MTTRSRSRNLAERMRAVSLGKVPTAMLSRQTAGIRGSTLYINVPGSPKAIDECLSAVFPAVPHCLELIGNEECGSWSREKPHLLE